MISKMFGRVLRAEEDPLTDGLVVEAAGFASEVPRSVAHTLVITSIRLKRQDLADALRRC